MEESTHFLIIFVAAILTNNILLTYFLGMCSFLACSRQIETALGLGVAVTFVTICTAPLNWLIYQLLAWAGIEFLALVIFIAVIAAFVQLVEMIVERYSPTLHYALGIFLPLITVNCAILGTSMFAMISFKYDLLQTVGYAAGSGLGWFLAILAIAGLRKKMQYSSIPKPLQGIGIVMIVTGIMAMAFMGFSGMVDISK